MNKNSIGVRIATFILVISMNITVGCGPHGMMCAKSRHDIAPAHGAQLLVPHNRKVFFTPASLDPNSYEFVARLDVTKVSNADWEEVLDILADMARRVGADAVIQVKIWRAPVGWSHSSPQGTGNAVALKEPIDTTKLSGQYR